MKKILTICIFLVLLTSYVSAFGVTTFYWEDRELIMNPGQTKTVQLSLQNEASSPDVTIEAKLTGGSNIAQLTGKTVYNLGPGENNVLVDIEVSIPETAQIGDKFGIGVMFTTVRKETGDKMVDLGTQISSSIPIVIGRVVEPKKSLTDIIPIEILGIMAIVIVLAAFSLAMLKKKKKKK